MGKPENILTTRTPRYLPPIQREHGSLNMYRLLLVEDDNGRRNVFARGLREQGFEVVTASDGTGALRTAALHPFDAVLMDIGLPDSDGRDVCMAMRAAGLDVPVLFLTARGQLADRLSGFASGGDDYLAKPVAFPELVARLRALLRRVSAPRPAGPTDLRGDPSTHSLLGLDRRVALSPTEFKLLARLLTTPDAVVRRRELIDAAWSAGSMVSDNTLDQYMSK